MATPSQINRTNTRHNQCSQVTDKSDIIGRTKATPSLINMTDSGHSDGNSSTDKQDSGYSHENLVTGD